MAEWTDATIREARLNSIRLESIHLNCREVLKKFLLPKVLISISCCLIDRLSMEVFILLKWLPI